VIRSRWNRFYLDQLGSKLLCRQIDIEFFNRLASKHGIDTCRNFLKGDFS